MVTAEFLSFQVDCSAALLFEDDLREMKPPFPPARNCKVSVMRVLEAAKELRTIEQIEKRVRLVVAALARLGHLASADGGQTVSLRAAA